MADEPQPEATGAPELRFAHYRVLRRSDGSTWELGRGAMGVTYKAFDEELRIDVALKVITPGQVDDPKAQALFLREARAAARVRHPNVASVVFLSTVPGNFFYAMEFIAGESLADWLRTRGALPPMMAIGFAMQIARGLGAIHEQHIVHRDLKPANLMIVAAGREKSRAGSDSNPDAWQIKVIDFGLARGFAGEGLGTEVNAQTTGFRGTALYASPEQCEERGQIDGRSDLYSLGCILWEMLLGAPPFRARTHRELLNQHVSQAAPLERIVHLAASLQVVLTRLLAKDPVNRFADADVVVKALESCRERAAGGADRIDDVEHTTTHVEPASFATAGTGAIRSSRRGMAGIAIACAVVLLAGAAWYFLRGKSGASSPAGALTPTASPSLSPAASLRKAIAVLPFANLSPDKDNEYFADGIQEDVLSNLSKLRDLKVISRASVLGYKPGARNLKQIATDLGVVTIVDGSVRRAGNQVRVTASLIDARTDEVLWSANYDREMKDIFALQTDIAENVARAVQVQLSPTEAAGLRETRGGNPAAYDLYLRAVAAYRKYRNEDNERAIELFKRAIAEDQRYALAYAGLADAYEMKVDKFESPLSWQESAIEAAQKAISFDARCAEGYNAVAGVYVSKGWFGRAQAAYEKALQINPGDVGVGARLAGIYYTIGRWDDAWRLLRRAIDVDPENPYYCIQLGEIYLGMGEYEQGERWMRRAMAKLHDPLKEQQLEITLAYARKDYAQVIKLYRERLRTTSGQQTTAVVLGEIPGEGPPGYFHAMALGRTGDIATLRENTGSGLAVADPDGFMYRQILTSVAYLQRMDGKEAEMRETCRRGIELTQRAPKAGNEAPEPPWNIAFYAWLLGDVELCNRSLDAAVRAGLFLGRVDQEDTNVDVLKENPKFVGILADMNRRIEEMRLRIRALEQQYP